eukprot:evm.model.scf_1552.1 EVM.evm.TU.scf_1552.1   scf_1552:553-10466(-)
MGVQEERWAVGSAPLLVILLLAIAVQCSSTSAWDAQTCSSECPSEEGTGARCGAEHATPDDRAEILEGFEKIGSLLEESRARLNELSERLRRQEVLLAGLKTAAGLIGKAAGQPDRGDGDGLSQRGEKGGWGDAKASGSAGGAVELYHTGFQKTVAVHRESFVDHLKMLAVVRADAAVTAVQPMHTMQGLSRYIVVGDAMGKLYFFAPQGDLLAEYHTGVTAAVTALAFYAPRRNMTAILTGHNDGSLRIHLATDQVNRPRHEPAQVTILDVSLNKVLLPQASHGDSSQQSIVAQGLHIKHIVPARVGRHRMAVIVEGAHGVRVVHENGTMAEVVGELETRILAVRLDAPNICVVHEEGVAILKIDQPEKRNDVECGGLVGTRLQSAEFDPHDSAKIYAYSQNGELLALHLAKDFKTCRVRSRRQLRLPPGPSVLKCIKNYLLLATDQGLAVFNTTSAAKSGPRDTLMESFAAIGSIFGLEVSTVPEPLVGSNVKQLVTLRMGDRLVGFFESRLPTVQPPKWNFNLWNQPIFIALMMLVGMWQFMRHYQPPPNPYVGPMHRGNPY